MKKTLLLGVIVLFAQSAKGDTYNFFFEKPGDKENAASPSGTPAPHEQESVPTSSTNSTASIGAPYLGKNQRNYFRLGFSTLLMSETERGELQFNGRSYDYGVGETNTDFGLKLSAGYEYYRGIIASVYGIFRASGVSANNPGQIGGEFEVLPVYTDTLQIGPVIGFVSGFGPASTRGRVYAGLRASTLFSQRVGLSLTGVIGSRMHREELGLIVRF